MRSRYGDDEMFSSLERRRQYLRKFASSQNATTDTLLNAILSLGPPGSGDQEVVSIDGKVFRYSRDSHRWTAVRNSLKSGPVCYVRSSWRNKPETVRFVSLDVVEPGGDFVSFILRFAKAPSGTYVLEGIWRDGGGTAIYRWPR